MKSISILSLGVSAMVLSACAQPPAPIAHKGNLFYGKDGTSQFAEAQRGSSALFIAESAPMRQTESAPVESMQIVELPEPQPSMNDVETVSAPESIAVADIAAPEPAPQPVREMRSVSFTASGIQPAAAIAAPVIAEPEPAIAKLEPLPMEQIAALPEVKQEDPRARITEPSFKAPSDPLKQSNFIWPVEGSVVSRFGPKSNGLVNDGINIAAQQGEPIWAAADGEVVYAGNELKGYGKMVIVRHENGWMTAYAHASDMLVAKGDSVAQGDLIGYVGTTGAVNEPQLHFGIRDGKNPINPETLLPRRVASAQ